MIRIDVQISSLPGGAGARIQVRSDGIETAPMDEVRLAIAFKNKLAELIADLGSNPSIAAVAVIERQAPAISETNTMKGKS